MTAKLTIGMGTTVEEIANAFASNAAVHLEVSLSEDDLITLLERHREKSYGPALAQLTAVHRGATGDLCSRILDLYWEDAGAANSVATSGLASSSQLQLLLNHPSLSVRQHAHLSLFRLEFETASEQRMVELLEKNSGNDELSTTKRYIIANSNSTQAGLLKILSRDEVDHVAAAAVASLDKRGIGC